MNNLATAFEASALVNALPDAIIAVNQEGIVLQVNSLTETMFGAKRDELVGQRMETLLAELCRDQFLHHLSKLKQQPNECRAELGLELQGRHRDGYEFPIEIRLSTLTTGDGIVLLSVIRDVSARKPIEEELRNVNGELARKAAQALRHSEQRYRLLLENLLDGYAHCRMLFDDEGKAEDFVYIEVNRNFERITGLENVAGKTAVVLIPGFKESHPEVFELYGRVALSGKPERFEIDFKPFGKTLSISVYSPEREHFIAVFEDISDRHQREYASRELAAIVESAEEAIIGTTLDSTITSWNAAAERLYLYSPKEIIGRPITLLAPQGREGEVQEVIARASRGEATHQRETQRRRKDGIIVDVSVSSTPILNSTGKVVGVAAVAHDITDRKRSESRLHLQASALDAAANSIVITDREGQILWVNPAFTKLTGYETGEAIGRTLRLLKSGKHDADFYEDMWKTVLGGEVWQGEVINRRKDGSCYTEEMTITPVFSTMQEIENFVAIKQDVTERKSLEVQLQQSQKMEAVGRLAGGVAHDFNNMLMVIRGYADLLDENIKGDKQLSHMIDEILKAADRAASLTNHLLAFSRKQTLIPKVVDLNNEIAEMGKMLPRLIGEDIELTVIPGIGLGLVRADPSQVQQIMMNLVVNARDAMPDGGRLTIATANAEWDENYAETHDSEARPGSYVMLAVTDSGVGMDRDTQEHIFEPFFTTKDLGKGTGLGLSIVYGAVKQSGGFIWVYSEPGLGTTFKIYLPRVTEPANDPLVTNAEKKVYLGRETILLAEDEQGVREAVRDYLRAQGYVVLEASHPKAAIQVADDYYGPIHLLITDMIMPEMNGMELSKQLKATRPEMSVLYISGYTDRGMEDAAVAEAEVHFLQKPFAFNSLGAMVRKIVEADSRQE
jgi:PAS domain S-box-containing protein